MAKWLIVLLIVGALLVVSIPILAIVAAIAIPNFIHARAEAELSADRGNLKQIAVALEQYAVDHQGRYPKNLPELMPMYLQKIPVVPGGDGTGAYDYHRPASDKQHGAYEIWDDGTMDRTTLANLPGPGGAPCGPEGCKYVVYTEKLGLIGVPGVR